MTREDYENGIIKLEDRFRLALRTYWNMLKNDKDKLSGFSLEQVSLYSFAYGIEEALLFFHNKPEVEALKKQFLAEYRQENQENE